MSSQTITKDAGSPAPRIISPQRVARIAGYSYLVMFALALLSNFAVNQGVIEPGDGVATVANIESSLGMFRLGVLGFLIIVVLDVAIAWALHLVFRHVDRDLSLAAAWFRVAYSAILGVAIAPLYQVIRLVTGDAGSTRVVEETMSALGLFEATWLFGLVVFGVHLVLIGMLAYRSGLVPKALGMVLGAAGVAYAIDTVARVLLPDYESVAGLFLALVAVPSMLGEGWLALWLAFSRRLGAW